MSVTRGLARFSRSVSSMVMANTMSAPRRNSLLNCVTRPTATPRGQQRNRPATVATSFSVRNYQATGKRNVNGDKQLLEFLNEEIREEAKAHSGNLPAIDSFDASSDEATITLTKKSGSETIAVKFNVNNSIEMDEDSFDEEVDQNKQEEQPAATVSVPAFTVEISRGGKYRLAIRCSVPEMDADEEEPAGRGEGAAEDPFDIEEVALYEKDWSDKTYTVQAGFMDGTLYDLLIQMLEDRGINQKFVDQLVEFSTNYEHGSYIRFLENLREFVKSK